MRASLNEAKPLPASTCPDGLEALAPPPMLLPGESLKTYQILRHAIFAEIAPRSAIEWLLTIDIVELAWEIKRYRLLRHKLLETSRRHAIASALSQIDMIGIPANCQQDARRHTQLNALAWCSDVDAANEIEQRLASGGLDAIAINVEVHAQSRDLYLLFEGMIISAQHRRATLLREINYQRHPVRTNLRHIPNSGQKISATLR